MLIIKNKYFLIIESIKDINLKNIKIRNKFFIIYRNHKRNEHLNDLIKFRQSCKLKDIKLYIANNFRLAFTLNADGVYLSSYNKSLKFLNYKKFNFGLIGSAHNFSEIIIKQKQRCNEVFLSPIFEVNKSKKFLNVSKFNLITLNLKIDYIALGGINQKNYKKIKLLRSKGFASISWVKKNGLRNLGRFRI